MALDPLTVIAAAVVAAFLMATWRVLLAAIIFLLWVLLMTCLLTGIALAWSVMAAADRVSRLWRREAR